MFCINYPCHMNKMTAMPIYDTTLKILLRSPMILIGNSSYSVNLVICCKFYPLNGFVTVSHPHSIAYGTKVNLAVK